MSDILSYKGYKARVEFDADDRIFFGRVAGIEDGVGFHADTVDDLIAAFHEAVDDYLETCVKAGKQPEKPYSGKLMFRVSPELHAQAAIAAKLAGKSLNTWAQEALGKAAGAGGVSKPTDDTPIKRIRIDMPSGMAAKLDAKAIKRGVTRQELIKVWLGNRLDTAG